VNWDGLRQRSGEVTRKPLTHGWRLKKLSPTRRLDAGVLAEAAGGEGWLEIPAMPAMVHDVLLHHGVIETPWLPGRAEACRWVAEQDWVYAVGFGGSEARECSLRLKGLDTIVDVYLNGELIGASSHMHRELRLDVTGRLEAENTLVLHFRSVFEQSEGGPKRVGHVDGDRARPVIRPGQNYSTYLGPNPYFSRVGVFGEVLLEGVDAAEIGELVVGAAVSEDLSRGTVTVQARGTSRAEDTRLRVRLVGPNGEEAGAVEAGVGVQGGAFETTAEIGIDGPELWWPRGYGEQPLYRVEVALVADGEEEQREERRVGFRRVMMPEPLHFEVNSVPVRMWGGNWVSPDWVTVVWNDERAARLFDIAENANFNAFRVWGPSEPPADGFYELADERGFMVWQDFHGMAYGPDEANRERCREDAALQLKRLKHHPAIMLWCGGNEAAMWHESEFRGPGGPWPGRVVVEEDLQQVCDALDPDRYFHPNSPYHGLDANDPQEWDTHGYTNMWYVPGYDYLVFASEDTRISPPPLHSVRRFFADEDVWPEDYSPAWTHGCEHPWPESWMKYTTGQSWMKTGPIEQLHDATDGASLVYRLGMGAALYYQDMVERQRRGRAADDPSDRRRCGGYLVWKYNDSWPQVYSGKVDYFLEPYISYYALKRAYAPVLLSLEVGAYIWLWAVNDGVEPVQGEVTMQLLHLDKNEVTKEVVRQVTIAPDQSVVVARLDEVGIGTFRREHILYACLRDGEGRVLARANALGHIERWVRFPDARLEVEVVEGALVLRTDKFARSVVLEGDADGDEFGWLFEDNWFDLAPGEEKRVRVLGRHERGRITARAWHSPHVTEVGWRR
jgi:beta-mannosidase